MADKDVVCATEPSRYVKPGTGIYNGTGKSYLTWFTLLVLFRVQVSLVTVGTPLKGSSGSGCHRNGLQSGTCIAPYG